MVKKHSKKSSPFKLVLIFVVIAAIFVTVYILQKQTNLKQEASISGTIGTYCTSSKDCSTGLTCENYKCTGTVALNGTLVKDGDYLCKRCSESNKYCSAVWHEGDVNCDRNNVISDTNYTVDCNCLSGTDAGTCPDGKPTKICRE